ncbi:FAD-dependent oxidoreductase [Lyngbya aestuarii]|uniref:FAD-dependent oxidoreductase n=1 Tax=Lyngbya aestuarii TaxID=118322 RepID=UPI00403D6EA6
MSRVAVIGCGIVGAAIAYELSMVAGLNVTVIDQNSAAQGSTGAALGVLMGVISKKVKGRAWQLRQASMQRYESLIPELEAITNRQIPFNRQGILMLHFAQDELTSWEDLVQTRQSQGWQLEIWDATQVQSRCPQLNPEKISGAIYSPQDRQVEPTALTQALVTAAQTKGATFQFGQTVEGIDAIASDTANLLTCRQIQTSAGKLEVDWLVIAAGLGSSHLTSLLQSPLIRVSPQISTASSSLKIKPVLGQALQLQLRQAIGYEDFQPVITGDDVHLVPLGEGQYWVGATVEFPDDAGEVVAEAALLEKVRQEAIAFCPALAQAQIVRTWSGKRPRPEGQPAPVIGQLSGYSNVLLATGHYRNGVLLAPATAQGIREAITKS